MALLNEIIKGIEEMKGEDINKIDGKLINLLVLVFRNTFISKNILKFIYRPDCAILATSMRWAPVFHICRRPAFRPIAPLSAVSAKTSRVAHPKRDTRSTRGSLFPWISTRKRCPTLQKIPQHCKRCIGDLAARSQSRISRGHSSTFTYSTAPCSDLRRLWLTPKSS